MCAGEEGGVVGERHGSCTITRQFSQTAFFAIPFNVTENAMSLRIRIVHVDHRDVEELAKYKELMPFVNNTNAGVIKMEMSTKVKIVSIGIYDSLEGLAGRPREVDYQK